MADETYHPRGSHPMPTSSGGSVTVFASTDSPGYLVGDIAIESDGTVSRWDGTEWDAISVVGTPDVQHVIGSGDPTGPAAGELVAYNDAGKIWLNVDSVWQLRFE
jgi:hypothetical protein